MPRFSEVYATLQDDTVPPAGPVAAVIVIGFWFRLSVDGQFVGWRFYEQTGQKGNLFGTLWDSDATTLLAIGTPSLKQATTPQVADGWRNFYAHPRAHLVANHDYLLGVATDGNGIYRTPNAFVAGPVTNGVVTAPQLAPDGITLNGWFLDQLSFNNPPNTSSGNLYGVDVLILPA